MGLPKNSRQVWFGVSKEKNPNRFSRLIQWFQGTSYSHALSIYYCADIGEHVVTNSHGPASQLDLLSVFLKTTTIPHLWAVEVTPMQFKSYMRRVVQLDGIPYSVKQIAGIVLARVFGLKKNIFRNKRGGMICSEHLDSLLESVGVSRTATVMSVGRELVSPKNNVDGLTELAKMDPKIKLQL